MPGETQDRRRVPRAVSREQRAALEKLRKAIRSAAPKAEECISYQLAAFRLDGTAARRVWRDRRAIAPSIR